MADAPAILDSFRRYAALIRERVGTVFPFSAEREGADAVQVERGVVFPAALTNAGLLPPYVDRLLEVGGLLPVTVVDRGGQQRPVYRSLLVYAWLQAFRAAYETLPRAEFGRWEAGLRPWCDALEARVGEIELPVDGIPAATGAAAAEVCWAAAALHVAGKLLVRDAWTDLASSVFGRLTKAQRPTGAFLRASLSDNPETLWYHELVILHAAAAYAVQSEDRPLAAAVRRNTEWHMNETQPDHATTQPWGLFAFLWNPDTHPVADALLHAAQTQQPAGLDGVSLILLADALYSLSLFPGTGEKRG